MAFGVINPGIFSFFSDQGGVQVFIAGNEILQSHDPKLVLLAAAICALGSFITLFLFAPGAREHGQGRSGWLFLAGILGRRRHVDHALCRAARVPPEHQHRLRPGVDRRRLLRRRAPRDGRPRRCRLRARPSGFVGGGILGLGVVGMHFTALASLISPARSPGTRPLLTMGAVLCVACGMLAVGRARNEGRNVQFIAPVLLAAGICIMHFVGMAAIDIYAELHDPDPDRRRSIRPSSATSSAAMTMLLVGTGAATTMIARGARKEAQTQLKNIADASVEGLILTDGSPSSTSTRASAAWSGRSGRREAA